MEVDAAGNGPCGGGFWRLPGGPVEAFLESREQSGMASRQRAPWVNLREGWMARLCRLPFPAAGRNVGPGLSPRLTPP